MTIIVTTNNVSTDNRSVFEVTNKSKVKIKSLSLELYLQEMGQDSKINNLDYTFTQQLNIGPSHPYTFSNPIIKLLIAELKMLYVDKNHPATIMVGPESTFRLDKLAEEETVVLSTTSSSRIYLNPGEHHILTYGDVVLPLQECYKNGITVCSGSIKFFSESLVSIPNVKLNMMKNTVVYFNPNGFGVKNDVNFQGDLYSRYEKHESDTKKEIDIFSKKTNLEFFPESIMNLIINYALEDLVYDVILNGEDFSNINIHIE